MKRLWIIAALLSLATPAAARDGYVLHSYCDGHYCSTYYGPRTYDNSARVIHVPVNTQPNTNPNWGRGCRSCADASK